MGLLNQDQWSALGLLGQGISNRNFSGGATAAMGYLDQAPERRMRQGLLEAQMAETQAQAQERAIRAQREQAEMEQQARLQSGLPGLFQPGAQGQGGGASAPSGFDVQAAIRLGMTPKMIAEYAALQNLNRQKVARTVKGMGPDGKEYEYQVDEFGQRVGDGMAQYRAPISVNRGNSNDFLDPYTLQPKASLKTFQSPDSVASNAISIRGQNMQDARSREANGATRVPAGYRSTPDGQGLEFIPGGPADPNAAKKAAPTEFQGKAAMFGDRAAEADRIITGLEGRYSPSAINTKKALGNVWGVGGALESAGNAVLPANAQKAEQAERDFVNAVLRLESGAAIGKDEFDNARKQYFPQPFDSAAVKKQKADNRARAIQGLMNNARTSGPQPAASTGGATASWGGDNDPLGLRK
jgi:hypothetical protein